MYLGRPTLLLLAACGATAQPKPAPPPPPPPESASAPTPTPARVAVVASPEPVAAIAEPDSSPPAKAESCNARRIQVSVTRATGEGSYILRISCSDNVFAVSSDRARPDGTELMNVFKVSPLEWERAWHAVESLRWRTIDDACSPDETRVGRAPRGPVYRVEIQDASDRRSFHCAGTRVFTDELDRIHAHLLSFAPSAAMPVSGVSERIGVPQCDQFLDRYQRCIDQKVPNAERSEFQSALIDTRVRLRDALVADPTSSPGLVKTCRELQKEAVLSTRKYGCQF